MDERLKNILLKAHSEYRDVRFSVYRTSLKLRRVQKCLKLDQIEASNALSILSQPLEGLSSSNPDQSYPDINVSGLQSVICRVFTQTQTKLGDEEIFPEALADLTTALVLHTYDSKNEGIVSLQAVRSFFIVMCERELLAKYKSMFWCHCEPGNKTLAKQDIALLLHHMIQITRLIQESNHFENVAAAVESCFSGVFGSGITEHDFVRWCLLEPQSIVWLPTMHRIASAETSQHQITCTLCKARPITGMRFRCLRCIDYNVCQRCFLINVNHKKSHKPTHPVQEYVHPVGRRESMKDFARTFRNMVTKRYKRKTFTRSFLPINQSGNDTGMVTETWQEQSVEMASLSLPHLEYGRSETEHQDVNVSRMSVGFADVSQLADEEKNKLDRLIERLEEERRRMMATTQILSAAQTQKQIEPSRSQTENTARQIERERLQAELKDIRSYNKDLERELHELRAHLHLGVPQRSSTPQLHHITPDHAHHTTEHTPDLTQHTDPYYTAHSTIPKTSYMSSRPHDEHNYSPAHENYTASPSVGTALYQSPLNSSQHYNGQSPHSHSYPSAQIKYGAPSSEASPYQNQYSSHDPHLRGYSPAHEKHVVPSSGEISPYHQTPHIGSLHYTNGVAPHFEKLKGGESHIGYSPSKRSHEFQVVSPKASRVPMRVPREFHRSLGNSPVPLDGESPVEFPKRSFRSLGNSPRTVEPEFGNSQKVGPWGSRKVLPDPPQLKMANKSQHPSLSTGVSGSSHRGRSSQSFDGSSPQVMYKSIGKESSSRSSSFSDISQSSGGKSKQKRRSSRDRSSKTSHRLSPSIQQAYRCQLEANKTASEVSVHTESQNSHLGLQEHDLNQPLTPKPKERHKRSTAPQRSHTTAHSKSYDSDSLSDSSSQKSERQRTKTGRAQKRSQSRGSSRRSSKERKPTPQKRIHTDAYRSTDSLNSRPDMPEKLQQRPRVSQSPNFSDSSHASEKLRQSTISTHAEPPNGRQRSKSGSSSEVSTVSDKKRVDLRSRFSRSDTNGSFAPPRVASSHENLEFAGSHPGSVDSLDTLHGGASNPSLGVYGTSKSGATSTAENSPRNFDPYSDIHSSDPNLGSKLTPELRARRGATSSPKPHKTRHSTPINQDSTSNIQIQSSAHDSLDTSHTSIHGTKSKDGSSRHSDSFSSGNRSHGAEERVSTPEIRKKRSPLVKKKKRHTSDGDSSDSRTAPEGDLKVKSEHLTSDHSNFESPEEEMKFLIKKLQGIMPSIHDQHTETRSSAELKSSKPMSEVLLAAHQTRQTIRLFTEYAIAVAAGEV